MVGNNETVSEVCAEMRYCKATSYSSSGCDGCNNYDCRDVRRFASRILAAYDREMAGVIAERDVEIRRRSTAERELAAKDAEIASLNAALKPVLEVNIEGLAKFNGIDCRELLSSVIAEAQRIVGAWDDKNYFWEDKNLTNKE